MICCQECGKGFVFKQQHDAVPGAAAHHTVDVDLRQIAKARWVLSCPACKDLAVDADQQVKHPTVGTHPNGDELIQCSACQAVYSFNDKWTFAEKETPWPVARLRNIYLVHASEDEIEAYATQAGADTRVEELQAEALELAGYRDVTCPAEDEDGERMWQSPSGPILSQSEALEEAEYVGGFTAPEVEVADVCD